MDTSTQRLKRSRQDKMIGGVAGGLANYLAVDPIIVRLIFVLLVVFYGVGPVAYLVLWVVMPIDPPQNAPQQKNAANGEPGQAFVAHGSGVRRARFDPMTGEPLNPEEEIPVQNLNAEGDAAADAQLRRNWILGVVLIALGAFFIVHMFLPHLAPFLLPAALIGAGVFLLRRNK
jgi:phage shock protein C